MQLNLPIYEQIADCKSILVAGMGGGFDVFCGLPIYLELQKRGHTVHLANFSFSILGGLTNTVQLTDTVYGITADVQGFWQPYFPELHLAKWFKQTGQDVTVWAFEKTGVRPLLAGYQALVDHLAVDGIVLIDGGVDSLLCGDEAELGTILEDTISLAAVNELDNVPVRLLGCVGFGVELNMAYAHVLENMAQLTSQGAFLGSCSLLQQMDSGRLYEEAVLFAHSQPHQDPSVINASIVSALRGEYGNYHLTEKTRGSRLWISPLMPIYWFFDLAAVAEENLLAAEILLTDTMSDVFREMYQLRASLRVRSPMRIPLE